MDSSSHLERGGTCAGQYFSDKNEPNPIIPFSTNGRMVTYRISYLYNNINNIINIY